MSFLGEPAESAGQRAMYEEDVRDDGFVWDLTRMWAHQPELHETAFEAAIAAAAKAAGLTPRERAMLVLGTASVRGDSLCATAWGRRLTGWSDAATAAATLSGAAAEGAGDLDDRERALLRWARAIARDPNATTAGEVQALRDLGFDDPAILALTYYAALRIAFSTTNDALGAHPDRGIAERLDPEVRAAIAWGRPAE